jgi:hypothetical protein
MDSPKVKNKTKQRTVIPKYRMILINPLISLLLARASERNRLVGKIPDIAFNKV